MEALRRAPFPLPGHAMLKTVNYRKAWQFSRHHEVERHVMWHSLTRWPPSKNDEKAH